jgi:hypothetical protein
MSEGAMADAANANQSTTETGSDIQAILDALQGLKFGVISIIVQDGVIVQIDRTEKRRFRRRSQDEGLGITPKMR